MDGHNSFGTQLQQQQRSSSAAAAQQQQYRRQQQQCAARLRRTTMSSSDGIAAVEPEAEAGVGRRVVEVVESSDDAVKVVSKPLGGRVEASTAAASFVPCKPSSSILYKSHGWLRSVDKDRAQCPSCAMSVPCRNSMRSIVVCLWLVE